MFFHVCQGLKNCNYSYVFKNIHLNMSLFLVCGTISIHYRRFGVTPVLLGISQLQEPLRVLQVVACSVDREKVRKKTLHQ